MCHSPTARVDYTFSHTFVLQMLRTRRHNVYFFLVSRFAFFEPYSRPPPFSSMNSTPACLRVFSMASCVFGSPAYRPTSILLIVFRCRPVASARSRTVQSKAARAIRTCALVTAIGRKVSDEFTVPLGRTHHRDLHRRGDERIWWQQLNLDPLHSASALWAQTHPALARPEANKGEAASAARNPAT
jgi:hypothetical protein